jgi:hypothetical protein
MFGLYFYPLWSKEMKNVKKSASLNILGGAICPDKLVIFDIDMSTEDEGS